MSAFLRELTTSCSGSYHSAIGVPLLKYVMTGEEKCLAQAKQAKGGYGLYFLYGVWPHLAPLGELSPEEKRFMHAAAELECVDQLATWLTERVQKTPAAAEAALADYLEAFGTGKKARVKAAVAVAEYLLALQDRNGQLSSVGRFLLSLTDEELKEVAADVNQRFMLQILIAHQPQRVPAVVPEILYRGSGRDKFLDREACSLLLAHSPGKYEAAVASAFTAETKLGPRFFAGASLTKVSPQKYQAETRKLGNEILQDQNWRGNSEEVCAWLVEQFQEKALPEIGKYLTLDGNFYCTSKVLKNTVQAFGPQAHPAVLDAVRNADPNLRKAALEQLLAWDRKDDKATILAAFQRGFEEKDTGHIIAFMSLAGQRKVQGLEESLWSFLEHKSKPVRQSAARAFGKQGDQTVARAAELLSHKKSAVRGAAVTLLSVAQTPAATKALEARLDDETDEEVRDQMLLALEQAWEAQGKKITQLDINARMERIRDKLKDPVAKWLDERKLPELAFRGKSGGKLSRQMVRYLLYRSSRAKEMRPDVEAKPLLAMIDRKSSGDFALAILQMFCASPMAAEDRWALALAGLLGDDRIVPPLMQQIRKWVDSNRGKLAEYAAQALALLGSDVALCAVDALSIRYRSKQKNIGKAASEAFADAAERLGMTVDELGDRVVPWLGFEPGQPRVIGEGEKKIEIRVGLDFKLEFRDLAKGKKLAALPASVPAELKNEFKDMAATAKEVIKGQLVRVENLMVRQYRWPVSRWRELYLAHPLLFPFASRLVWGIYDSSGKLKTPLRALEDRTLTNERDETVELPATDDGRTVGIVHPLELSTEDRHVWMTHLADYNVVSPFLQMERPVVYPADEEKQTKISTKYRGTNINAMTFRGRAEKLGWQRGSVTDGGGISSYRKSFPGAGADALLGLEGFYIGIDMYSEVKLEQFCFVKGGSVTFGSYEYDEPSNEDDQRLIPFEKVPPIVFSETLGDLQKIAGKKDGDEEENQ